MQPFLGEKVCACLKPEARRETDDFAGKFSEKRVMTTRDGLPREPGRLYQLLLLGVELIEEGASFLLVGFRDAEVIESAEDVSGIVSAKTMSVSH